ETPTASAATNQTKRPETGVVYSYRLHGVVHYSSRPPTDPASTEVRAIPYGYIATATGPIPLTTRKPRLYFKGYECTVDCSGHEAGYEWAQDRGIEHPDDCGGNSISFIEGCEAYAREVQLEMVE